MSTQDHKGNYCGCFDADECDRRTAYAEQFKRDAERYRWLRANGVRYHGMARTMYADEADERIDRRIAETNPNPSGQLDAEASPPLAGEASGPVGLGPDQISSPEIPDNSTVSLTERLRAALEEQVVEVISTVGIVGCKLCKAEEGPSGLVHMSSCVLAKVENQMCRHETVQQTITGTDGLRTDTETRCVTCGALLKSTAPEIRPANEHTQFCAAYDGRPCSCGAGDIGGVFQGTKTPPGVGNDQDAIDARRWRALMRAGVTYYSPQESSGPALACVAKRIWYHATDDQEHNTLAGTMDAFDRAFPSQ